MHPSGASRAGGSYAAAANPAAPFCSNGASVLFRPRGEPVTQYAVVDPATGETVKTYDTISDDDLKAAIGRAHEAHRAWSARPVEERAAAIRRVAELHNE